MRRRCGFVIVRVLGRLRPGCRGQHYRIQTIGCGMSLLDPVRLVDRGRGGCRTPLAAVAVSSVAPGVARSNCSNRKAVPALMDLALPKFAGPADRLTRPLRPWIVMTDSPAQARLADSPRSPSPCLNLDALSSEESTGSGDASAVPICISVDSGTHVNPNQVLLDDDLLTAVDVSAAGC